jgi:sulfur-carrier protein
VRECDIGVSLRTMAVLRLFASAREAAGTGRDQVGGATVAEVLDAALARYGEAFAAVLPSCRIWLNGEQAAADAAVRDGDEVAVLPPVSGGAA